jgi:hypothetical protein
MSPPHTTFSAILGMFILGGTIFAITRWRRARSHQIERGKGQY